ncbi:hypothetical protein HDU77_007416 [Chytriomyces hyalinus]|nr:hypothetical protein HDU77_007416 [Chytriomyces hyalinus]
MTTKIFCVLSNSDNLTGFHVDFDVSLSVGDLKDAIHKMKDIAGSAELTLVRICKGDVGGLTKDELERSLDLFKLEVFSKSRERREDIAGACLTRDGFTFKVMNLMEQVSLFTASLPANLYHVLVLVGVTMNCTNCLTTLSSLRNCTKCHRASYCNEQCQAQHWDVHRHVCKKGYKIVTTASKGKFLQSTRAFQAGNVIFQEKPLVTFPNDGQLLVQVLQSEDLYNQLLRLFCPSEESFNIIHNQEFFKHVTANARIGGLKLETQEGSKSDTPDSVD